jgi:hypothetical protein
MANVTHSSLTGVELHEPKGCAAASGKSVYVSDGSSSGDWAWDPYVIHADVSIPGSIASGTHAVADWLFTKWVYVPWPATLSLMSYSYSSLPISGAVASVNNIITLYDGSDTAVTGGTVSATGTEGTGTITPTANNTFTAGQWCKITRSLAGLSNNVFHWHLTLRFDRTGT